MDFSRRDFLALGSAVGALAAGCTALKDDASLFTDGVPLASEGGIRVRFLGSGAAGWKPEWRKKNPYARRQSSLLVENRVLLDFTPCSFDHLPEGCRPEALFQTHSHGDHYNPAAAVKVGVKRLYVHESWAAAARAEVRAAAGKLGLPAPEVIALPFARPVETGGLRITAVPSNHSTSRVTDGVLERTAMYLVEKGPSRLLYATDTGGIPGDAARMIGIDRHVREESWQRYANNPFVHRPAALTAFIMEATDGDNDDDFRQFVHSSVQCVSRLVNMLSRTGRYTPPAGQHAYLTHIGIKYRAWDPEKINRELPEPLRAAYDGLELVMG